MKILSAILFILVTTIGYSSQKAITDTGDEIVIYSDGTWKNLSSLSSNIDELQLNNTKFKKPAKSSFLLKSTRNHSAYWINTDKWSFKKTKSSDDASEYTFQLKNKALYAMAITEEISIPIASLIEIAFNNAKDVAPDVNIISKEYRVVNGKKVVFLEMAGTLDGIKFTYRGYYYSDKFGTTQLVAYTSTNLVQKYETEINNFLNGLVTQ